MNDWLEVADINSHGLYTKAMSVHEWNSEWQRWSGREEEATIGGVGDSHSCHTRAQTSSLSARNWSSLID